MKHYNVLIVGCGITGAAMAYELSKYKLSVGVVEACNDVGCGATKANSAILHAGYDPVPGTLCAKLNVEGIRLAKEICKKLSVLRRELPSLVLAFTQKDLDHIEELYYQGRANGVEGIRILSTAETLAMEPNINPEVLGALYAPSAIVDPWEYTCAMAETAVRNGADIHLSNRVDTIKYVNGIFLVTTSKDTYTADYVVNAAGSHADKIAEMIGDFSFKQHHRCGEYYVLDKVEGTRVNSVVFRCPDENGKGVLVSPTVHGNLIVGPDAYMVDRADSVATVAETLKMLKPSGLKSVPSIDFSKSIHEYAGNRPISDSHDFIIRSSYLNDNFLHLAGIKSPGLSAAPAIALEGIKILSRIGLKLEPKEEIIDERKVVRFNRMTPEEKAELIRENPLYGRVICRCETVTEGEILDAIRRPITPRSLDSIKRRTGASIGRCQGGFCSTRIHDILARELGVSPLDITLGDDGSYILVEETKEAKGNA